MYKLSTDTLIVFAIVVRYVFVFVKTNLTDFCANYQRKKP